MGKIYTALGLMTGTSMDGVDLSIIKSDGYSKFISVFDDYYEFDQKLQKDIIDLRNQIFTFEDLKKSSEKLKILERELTLLQCELINKLSKEYLNEIDLIGFHGQTIFHDSKKKISKQLGDGKLLSQIVKKIVINNFRENDLRNGGQGAPLTPIFHDLIVKKIFEKYKISYPINIINIGGITNITQISVNKYSQRIEFHASDIGPGNCLIDDWIRNNSNKKFDENSLFAKAGNLNDLIYNQAVDNFSNISYDNSLDIKDFNSSFVKGLSLEDGCVTLTKFSAYLIAQGIKYFNKLNKNFPTINLICGGGRKNESLINFLKDNFEKNIKFKNIDEYKFNGDFIESQSFAYLAIKSYLNLPISFPNTTGCKEPTVGGNIYKNF